jgi:SH3-like domain-containing protein
MKQDGKFLLFDVTEFASWLDQISLSRVIHLLQVHHTYSPSYADFHQTNHFPLLHAMEHYHMVERGFSEIAQNLTTFPDGLIAVCRPIDTIPAGIKGANKNGICVENLGNFDGQDTMTSVHRDCILNVYALLCRKFRLPVDTDHVAYHHWYDLTTGVRTNGTGNTKTCPGTLFFSGNTVGAVEANFLPLVAQRLAALSASDSPPQEHALYTAEVAVETLNVRAAPTIMALTLKQLGRGVEVEVYEERNGWRRIDSANPSWVDGQFLTSPASPAKVPALYSAQVTADLLNVRALPSIWGKITNQLNRGANIYVYEERDGWCKIDSANSLWVNGSYLGEMVPAVA